MWGKGTLRTSISLSYISDTLYQTMSIFLLVRGRSGEAETQQCHQRDGTRIIYDRKFLMECRNSPIARTPPCYLPQIPGVTLPQHSTLAKVEEMKEHEEMEKVPVDDAQFDMDI
uniref:Eukaryotic translation initiation factor 4E binding protein 3 n=1 Tax=Callorhinchus milii TaxID=7868 RepID=A0A4W3HFQ9_CALMI